MKQFFGVVVGGLFAILAGVSIARLVRSAAPTISATLASFHVPSIGAVADAIMKSNDGTTVIGMARTIRWTASEEEDSSSALESIPPTSGKITAASYLVKDLSHAAGTVISQDPDRLMPIASLTKLVTAVIARRLIPPAAHIRLTAAIIGAYGNTADFKVGETFTAGDLVYPLLMVSSNDAAEAYAQYFGRPQFIAAMNDFAQSIGAYRTYFADPSGLSPYNVSTATDLAIILDWIRANDPTVITTTELKAKTVGAHTWINPTHFLSWSNYAGGKNGYTPEANRTGASLFKVGRNGDIYAVIVLGSSARDADEFTLLSKIGK